MSKDKLYKNEAYSDLVLAGLLHSAPLKDFRKNEMSALEKDQVVDIYQDPITQKDFEGRATLISEYRPDEGDGLSMWVVRFHDEPESTYTRTIYTKPE